MNRQTDLQRVKQRKIGKVAVLSAMITGMVGKSQGSEMQALMIQRANLLTNGGQPPIPGRMLNQRQQRKRARQNPNA